MAVNPNLAALMRVIEDNQDKMPEGEYLQAMNALGALHREIPAPGAAAPAPASVAPRPMALWARPLPIPSYTAAGAASPAPAPAPLPSSSLLFASVAVPGMENMIERDAWNTVRNEHPDHFGISAQDWMQMSQEDRDQAVREATECVVSKMERRNRNPDPSACTFIARHAVGPWRLEGLLHGRWECVCGYKGYSRNWQKHEKSERHQDWSKHRTVSRRKTEMMKEMLRKDEEGYLCRFKPRSQSELGGIRCFLINQEQNEWTNPELYDEIHRSPIPTDDGVGRWFVHRREPRSRVYIQW